MNWLTRWFGPAPEMPYEEPLEPIWEPPVPDPAEDPIPEDIDVCGPCQGAGEVCVGVDYWGMPYTEPCVPCGGTGQVQP